MNIYTGIIKWKDIIFFFVYLSICKSHSHGKGNTYKKGINKKIEQITELRHFLRWHEFAPWTPAYLHDEKSLLKLNTLNSFSLILKVCACMRIQKQVEWNWQPSEMLEASWKWRLRSLWIRWLSKYLVNFLCSITSKFMKNSINSGYFVWNTDIFKERKFKRVTSLQQITQKEHI